MTRHLFGGTAADVAEDASGARVPGARGTVWDGPSGGATQITDLTAVDGSPITELVADDFGMVPSFYGPDGLERLYVDFGATRVALLAADVGDRLSDHLTALDPHGDRAAVLGLLGAPTGIATLGADGKVPSAQLPAASGGASVTSVQGYVGDVMLQASDIGAAPTSHTHTAAETGAAPAAHTHTAADVGALALAARGAAGGVASLDPAGRVPAAQLPVQQLPGTWQPDDWGLRSWSYDLSAGSRTPGDRPSEAGRLYLVGVPLRAASTISRVACHVMGFDKPNSTVTDAYLGVYNSALQRLATTPSLKAAFPETHNIGGQMAAFSLSNSVSLSPGSYYIAILVKGAGTTVPYLAATNWGASSTTAGAKAADVNGAYRWLQTSSTTLTSLPASLTLGDMADGMTCYWAGMG
ncbi:hypothetical protein [Streptomyces sp. NPDC053048]|uniref:hypothetical protein n=1 Tax=Streptomyces sp. NPDC053048 TaxID=3365694 RepID=UPI0037D5709F